MTDVTIRALDVSDAPIIAKLANDYDVAKMLATMPHPYDLSHAKEFLAKSDRLSGGGTGYNYAISVDGVFAGSIGWFRNEEQEVELGYWVARSYWGQGVGAKAVGLILEDVRETTQTSYVVACVMDINPASRVILIRNGFILDKKEVPQECASAARDGAIMPAKRYVYTY